MQLCSPKAPTAGKNFPASQLWQLSEEAAPLLLEPYFPVSQLMQTESFFAPTTELHLPCGQFLHSDAVVKPSTSE